MSYTKHSSSATKRRGIAAVEFAVIAPVMIAFTFGLIEVGRIMLIKQTATHATREGARVAIRPTANDDDVYESVNKQLAIMGVTNAKIETDPMSLEDAEPGSSFTVRVKIDLASVSWIPGFFHFGTSEIVAESAMQRESTN